MRRPSRFSEAGFEPMKLGAFLLVGRTKRPDLHRTARQRFSPLSAGSSVLDDLWIVVIILEQPAYALIAPSRPIRFWLLILSLQVLPQNKIKLISSEKERTTKRVESGFRELSATTPIRSPKSVPDTVSRSREFQVHIHPRARAYANVSFRQLRT